MEIRDIAKAAGVGLGTVSRVLNNRPGVSIKTRELVIGIMNKYSYQPNAMARGLATKKTWNIEVVFNTASPKISQDPIVLKLLDGMHSQMLECRYMMFFSAIHSALSQEDANAVVFSKRGHIDGLILVTNRMGRGFLSALKRRLSVPVTLVDYHVEDRDVGCVAGDNRGAAYEAVKYLYGQGYRKIGFIGMDMKTQSVHLRYEGYKSALADLNLDIRDERVIAVNSVQLEDSHIEELLTCKSPPDAVFVASEGLAQKVLAIAEKAGIRAPRQVAIVAFGEVEQSTGMGNSLPAITVQWEKIGSEAVRVIVDSIETGNRPEKLLVPSKLIAGLLPASCESTSTKKIPNL